ncbi:MAG: AAA family ATPase [Treponema sp.]|jgi:chromosome segregation protein|nr:AAA family ATPase [Treponema sp.]
MFLKNLDILGFKSFADSTKIAFSDGITALLGPNGCGKSNVVDAIKWVLGEQASRSMRAEKMEDLIFNGTENRKALNLAEVTLTLENESGVLALDTPEVAIKRRLYRSGESEYFINAKPVRLKEVRELFWDTGVGKTAYSVMEQGKIDQILSSKPEERRYLFEEAAGITRYKLKIAEDERKLLKTQENVRQVEGILGEVKRSYDSLKSQSEKTLKYRSLKDDIFHFELDIQLLRLKQFRYNRDERNETLKRRTEERDKLRGEAAAAQAALEASMDNVNELEGKLAGYQKEIYGIAVEKNAREKEARLLAEQRAEVKAKIGQNEGRERAVTIKIEELGEDADEQDASVKELKKQVEAIEGNIREFEESVNRASARMRENTAEAARAEDDIHAFDRERAGLEKDLEAITDDIVAALDAGLREAGYSAAERRSAEAALEETLGRLHTVLAGRETLTRDLAAAIERAGAGGALPQDSLKQAAASLAQALSGAAADAERAAALFEAYRKSTPAFIDEFVAPEGIITRKRALDGKIRACREGVSERREKIAALRRENDDLGTRVAEYRKTLERLRVNRAQMEAQAKSAEEQARLIRRELAGQQGLLKTIQDELFFDRKRFDETGERIAEAEEEAAELDKKGRQLTKDLEQLEKDINLKNGDVAGKQEAIKKKTAELSRVQEALEKLNMELAQTETEIRNIQENFREAHSRDLLEFEERIFTIKAEPAALREELLAARNALRDLGQVNLAAPEEFAETKARYDLLSGQLADLAKAREDLEKITAEIRQESSALFIATYNKIKKNFHNLFRRLFGGGKAELRLLDGNHVLESGIEIFAQPPGKKLENINLLSGGERSMTAVALLFATYMVKPSPFCLLDEIDAALDEENVSRFVRLLREFATMSQFIVITHNKKTVTGAGALLGVTMEESGVTKLISVKLEHEGERQPDPPQDELWQDEDIEPEEGRELPIGVDDPAQVTEADLHPIRGDSAVTPRNDEGGSTPRNDEGGPTPRNDKDGSTPRNEP